MAESYPMNGGDGMYSYTKNSDYQREGSNVAKSIIDELITKNLDLTKLSLVSNTFHLADLGCSTGPNTFFNIRDLIEVVSNKYWIESWELPVFQVYFNDHATNDFNTLFASLSPKRQYFAAGVPGTFHGRLFPTSSLHLVSSCYALQWLSKSPRACVDKNSKAYNKGKIHYFGAPSVVGEAYAAQFASDMEVFLEGRAKEIVVGGMMVIVMFGYSKDMSPSSLILAFIFQQLESILLDMVNMGIISESKMNSFNIPVYAACPEDITKAIIKNGDFSILRLELTNPSIKVDRRFDCKASTLRWRAIFESVFSKHFGAEVTDKLFDRLYEKSLQNSVKLEACNMDKSQLLVILKRK